MPVTSTMPKSEAPAAAEAGHIIAFGNEKGGTGKTTTAMHIVVSLLKLGRRVAAIDLDSRQKSFARYIENRGGFAARTGHALPMPTIQVIDRSKASHKEDVIADESQRLEQALSQAR